MSTAATIVTDDKKTEDEKINWLSELRGLALMLLAVLGFHSFIAKPFYIPSESMMPNLLVGDRLVVSKYPYGWSWASASFHLLPRGDWRIWPATPEYGDIVIPVHPERDEDYIKRVVALPGDTIEIRNGQILLNGEAVPQQVEPAIPIPIDENSPCDYFCPTHVFLGRFKSRSSCHAVLIRLFNSEPCIEHSNYIELSHLSFQTGQNRIRVSRLVEDFSEGRIAVNRFISRAVAFANRYFCRCNGNPIGLSNFEGQK